MVTKKHIDTMSMSGNTNSEASMKADFEKAKAFFQTTGYTKIGESWSKYPKYDYDDQDDMMAQPTIIGYMHNWSITGQKE